MRSYIITTIVSDDFGDMHIETRLIHAGSLAEAKGLGIEYLSLSHPEKSTIKYCKGVEIRPEDLT